MAIHVYVVCSMNQKLELYDHVLKTVFKRHASHEHASFLCLFKQLPHFAMKAMNELFGYIQWAFKDIVLFTSA